MLPSLLAPHAEAWVYLAANPLSWLTLTLVAYVVADRISIAFNRHPAVNLVALAALFIILALKLTGTSYETYFAGAQFIHFLLGPATVALAVPLYRNFERVRATALPIVASLGVGSVVAIVSAVVIARALGASPEITASIAPKSVTSPIAMGLAEKLGGAPFLTAALVIATGVFGAIILSPLMRLLRIKDPAAVGMAAGLASHGIGAARAFHIDSTAGAFAGIGMGLNGAFTSVILPILRPFLGL
ncbi:LrgB family protein [Rhodoblastus sp.]|jgi:predicted murein hydrolase (TIGR00659 family)|uniref:LrgB family protein n=1 Tax=Rhodoblastus sp. TaxID=1962975 RepID=UPI002617F40A|nr:LrgB family protein [Rhodoblastus sp.]